MPSISVVLTKRAKIGLLTSFAVGVFVGWVAAKSSFLFSSYDECVLRSVKSGMTNAAVHTLRKSCENLYK